MIDKKDNIELRQYDEYVIARTSIPISQSEEDNNMFRVLASYIFGRNEKNQSIPMTAPVRQQIQPQQFAAAFPQDDIGQLIANQRAQNA